RILPCSSVLFRGEVLLRSGNTSHGKDTERDQRQHVIFEFFRVIPCYSVARSYFDPEIQATDRTRKGIRDNMLYSNSSVLFRVIPWRDLTSIRKYKPRTGHGKGSETTCYIRILPCYSV